MSDPLYDCFICHASEDKEAFVRPLAEALRENRIEVWYDEFSLNIGDSLRRSIDRGLKLSRFGIVVLSPSFFSKSWTNWELDGLLQRELYEPSTLILPIWHGIDRSIVADYSPSLADKIAVSTSSGVADVVSKLIRTIKPYGSLIEAREVVGKHGLSSPVISDDWWLDVIEDSAYQDERRFAFNIMKLAKSRGEQIAWWAMQKNWQEAAECDRILQTTHPDHAWKFIKSQPGLLHACELSPKLFAEYMPQLTIPGFGDQMEDVFSKYYAESRLRCEQRRLQSDRFGSGCTTDGQTPICDEEFTLRDPDFGFYEPEFIACGFVQGYGAGLGPSVRGMPVIDYIVWALSTSSNWMPRKAHAYLLDGFKKWKAWPNWSDRENRELGYSIDFDDSLMEALRNANTIKSFRLAGVARKDLFDRIAFSVDMQDLPETPDAIFGRFISEKFIEVWYSHEPENISKRRRKITKPKKNA